MAVGHEHLCGTGAWINAASPNHHYCLCPRPFPQKPRWAEQEGSSIFPLLGFYHPYPHITQVTCNVLEQTLRVSCSAMLAQCDLLLFMALFPLQHHPPGLHEVLGISEYTMGHL